MDAYGLLEEMIYAETHDEAIQQALLSTRSRSQNDGLAFVFDFTIFQQLFGNPPQRSQIDLIHIVSRRPKSLACLHCF